VIEPLLPNEPRSVPRVDVRRVLNGIWVLRSKAQSDRAVLPQAEALPPRRAPLRQARRRLLAMVQLASMRLWLRAYGS